MFGTKVYRQSRIMRKSSLTGRATTTIAPNDSFSREDLELIDRCRPIDAVTWFKIAQWGTKSKLFHWKVAGIAKIASALAIVTGIIARHD